MEAWKRRRHWDLEGRSLSTLGKHGIGGHPLECHGGLGDDDEYGLENLRTHRPLFMEKGISP